MNKEILNITIKELTAHSSKDKREAIFMLIESIADDKVYDARVTRETEIESKELDEVNKIDFGLRC